jgi:hypothetical protein
VAEALCLNCGTPKRVPSKKCGHCGFEPGTDEQALIKSVYLSTQRFDDDEEEKIERYWKELDRVSASMRAGEPPSFDPTEMARLRAQLKLYQSVPMSSVWGAVFRLFRPVIIAIVIIWGLIVLFRWIKQ